MLDERKELKLYTFDIDDPAAFPREGYLIELGLHSGKGSRGKVDFKNMGRPFEIIARQCLFGEGASFAQASRRAEDALRTLRAWCGFLNEGEDAPDVEGLGEYQDWMPRYIKACIDQAQNALGTGARPQSSKKRLTLEDALDEWEANAPRYDLGIYDNSTILKANEARFQLSVARALRKGPLKRWCMVGKLVPNEACKKLPNGSALDVRSNGAVLASTALCLMGLRRGEGKRPGVPGETGYVPISMQELGRWCCLSKEYSKGTLTGWLYQGEPLFDQHEEKVGVKLWQVSQIWLDEGQWQLIDITDGYDALREFCEEHEGEGYRCYMDNDYERPDFEPQPHYNRLRYFDCDDCKAQLGA